VRVRDEICDRFTENAYLDPRDVDVEVHGGRVMLSGSVGSKAQRSLAEYLARAVPGVADVRNRLQVKPTQPTQPTRPMRRGQSSSAQSSSGVRSADGEAAAKR
jgi:hypothetical protein